MINSQSTFNKSFNSIFWLFGIVSFIGIAGYGLSYILKMPEISPNEFVPKTIDTASFNRFGFGNLLAVFIILYAFAFLPIVIQFSIIKHCRPIKTDFDSSLLLTGLLSVVSFYNFSIFKSKPP